jgi:hypothetical protein
MTHTAAFEALSEVEIGEYVARQQEEHLHLDFKLVKDSGLATTDDRRNLAIAMSGFANSAGGLIVWGVDARRNSEGVDCASSLIPTKNVILLLSRLNSLTGEASDPPIDGVRHRAIEAGGGGLGYAVTLVPESEVGPHMAKLGENRYYKRVGDSFYKMEHYDIADMFGRRRKPYLQAFYRVSRRGGDLQVRLGIRNLGRATARAPFFSFQNEGPLQRAPHGLDGNGIEGLPRLPLGSVGLRWAYGGGMDFSLHPGMAQEIAALDLGIRERPFPTQDVQVEYAIACNDQPLERGSLAIPISELRDGA